MSDEGGDVSWREAYRVGLAIAINHKIFTILVVFALLCQRFLSFFSHYTGLSVGSILSQYQGMIVAFSENPFAGPDKLAQYSEFYILLLPAAVLFLIGLFVLIGIVALMKDLLLQRGYKVTTLAGKGWRYFWPVMRLKLPVYAVVSCSLLLLIAPVIQNRNNESFLIWAIGCGIIGTTIFIAIRILLSLGEKMIILEGKQKNRKIIRRIFKIIRPAFHEVILYYCVMFIMIGFSLLFPVLLKMTNISMSFIIIISLILASFVTVVIKASSFCFYLQLVGEVSGVTHKS